MKRTLPKRFARRSNRRVLLEALESRWMLAADWENPGQSRDVNDDLFVSPLDALVGINRLNDLGPGPLGPRDVNSDEPFYDVNGDESHSPIDVLLVFNSLNERDLLVAVKLANVKRFGTRPGRGRFTRRRTT